MAADFEDSGVLKRLMKTRKMGFLASSSTCFLAMLWTTF